MSFHYHHIPLESEEEFVDKATAELEQMILDAIEKRGKCVLGLSGGSTPRAIYTALGELKIIEWEKVTIFLVDDRYVPADHDESNQKLVRETLLSNASIPESQIIFPDTSLALEECIEDYDHRIGQLLSDDIDVIVLGMGEDGHIASLFPGDIDALLEGVKPGGHAPRKDRSVIHTTTDRFAIRDRITVSLPVLTGAGKTLFLLKGDGKKKIFAEVLSANVDPMEYPAHALLETGRTVWLTYW